MQLCSIPRSFGSMNFFLIFHFNCLRRECSRIRKSTLFLTWYRAKQIHKFASAELPEWTENVVNVENCQFLKKNCEFLSVIWVILKQSVCSITIFYCSNYYSLFLPFFILEIFNFTNGKFFNRLEQIWKAVLKMWKSEN